MSLQQALLAHVPLAQKRAELEKIVANNYWAIRRHYLDPRVINAVQTEEISKVYEARQAFYSAQDQLARINGFFLRS